jgi:hypothetical protein
MGLLLLASARGQWMEHDAGSNEQVIQLFRPRRSKLVAAGAFTRDSRVEEAK